MEMEGRLEYKNIQVKIWQDYPLVSSHATRRSQ